jgi:hypothetical protein
MFWTGWGNANYDIQPGYYDSYKGGESLNGALQVPKQSVQLDKASTDPRHVMCRRVIRVR